MKNNYIKIKYHPTAIKWLLTIFFLVFNLALFTIDDASTPEDNIVTIIIVVVANCLAIFSFIILSYFPKLYFVFEDDGCSFQNRKKKRIINISKENILKIGFGYFTVLPAVEIIWRDATTYKRNKTYFEMSYKSYMEIYNSMQWVKELADNSSHKEKKN